MDDFWEGGKVAGTTLIRYIKCLSASFDLFLIFAISFFKSKIVICNMENILWLTHNHIVVGCLF